MTDKVHSTWSCTTKHGFFDPHLWKYVQKKWILGVRKCIENRWFWEVFLTKSIDLCRKVPKSEKSHFWVFLPKMVRNTRRIDWKYPRGPRINIWYRSSCFPEPRFFFFPDFLNFFFFFFFFFFFPYNIFPFLLSLFSRYNEQHVVIQSVHRVDI